MKEMYVNGYLYKGKLEGFFELPLGNNLTLSIYDSEEGYEIEIIEDVDYANEYIDCMIFKTTKWERLKDLLYFAKNNTYSSDIRKRIKKAIKENTTYKEVKNEI